MSVQTPGEAQVEVPPLLSVLTPSYGYGRFIGSCLASVEGLGLGGRVEHIVADGGSTDSTVDELRAAESRSIHKVIWWSRPDGGQSAALNEALGVASGDWVGWLNADECYLPELSKLLANLTTTSADVVVGECVFVDEELKVSRLLGSHRPTSRILATYGCCFSSCATFIRREALGTDPFDPACRMVMDWDLWLTLADRGCTFEFHPVAVAAFRVHPAQVTAEPLALMSPENQHVRAKHGLPTSAPSVRCRYALGRAFRIVAKLRSGAYVRQVRRRVQSGGSVDPNQERLP